MRTNFASRLIRLGWISRYNYMHTCHLFLHSLLLLPFLFFHHPFLFFRSVLLFYLQPQGALPYVVEHLCSSIFILFFFFLLRHFSLLLTRIPLIHCRAPGSLLHYPFFPSHTAYSYHPPFFQFLSHISTSSKACPESRLEQSKSRNHYTFSHPRQLVACLSNITEKSTKIQQDRKCGIHSPLHP